MWKTSQPTLLDQLPDAQSVSSKTSPFNVDFCLECNRRSKGTVYYKHLQFHEIQQHHQRNRSFRCLIDPWPYTTLVTFVLGNIFGLLHVSKTLPLNEHQFTSWIHDVLFLKESPLSKLLLLNFQLALDFWGEINTSWLETPWKLVTEIRGFWRICANLLEVFSSSTSNV